MHSNTNICKSPPDLRHIIAADTCCERQSSHSLCFVVTLSQTLSKEVHYISLNLPTELDLECRIPLFHSQPCVNDDRMEAEMQGGAVGPSGQQPHPQPNLQASTNSSNCNKVYAEVRGRPDLQAGIWCSWVALLLLTSSTPFSTSRLVVLLT